VNEGIGGDFGHSQRKHELITESQTAETIGTRIHFKIRVLNTRQGNTRTLRSVIKKLFKKVYLSIKTNSCFYGTALIKRCFFTYNFAFKALEQWIRLFVEGEGHVKNWFCCIFCLSQSPAGVPLIATRGHSTPDYYPSINNYTSHNPLPGLIIVWSLPPVCHYPW